MKTLFTLLNSRIHLGAHSRKKAVQGMNLVEKIPAKQGFQDFWELRLRLSILVTHASLVNTITSAPECCKLHKMIHSIKE